VIPIVLALAGLLGADCGGDNDRGPALGHLKGEQITRGTPDYEAAVEILRAPSASRVQPGWDSERLWSRHVDWEPAVAADSDAPFVYQLTTRYYVPACDGCASPAIVFRRSRDGGVTWERDRYLAAVSGTQNDPQIEVAGNGVIYACYLQDFEPGVVFQQSSDGGLTWSEPLVVAGMGPPSWSDKPALVVSEDGRDVYVGFNAGDAYVAASHDGGRSFENPVRTSTSRRAWFHGEGAVAPNGDVYLTAVDFSQDYTSRAGIHVLRSTDGGRSFVTTLVDTSAEMPACAWASGCYLGFLGPSTALAIDAAGVLVIAYNAGESRGEPQSLWVRGSEDGVVWSSRRRVSTAPPGVNHAFPSLAVGPGAGDFRLVWQDDRRAPTRQWNTWYRRTADGGRTWSEVVRLSDAPSEQTTEAGGYRFPYGDYLDIAVDGTGTNHVIWGEGESYDGVGGSWFTRGR